MSEPPIAAADVAAGTTTAVVQPLAAHNPRARKLRSLVWNDFTKERRADGSFVAICNHCKKQLTASSRSGTTHLKNHLGICLSTKRTLKRKKLVVRRLVLKSVDAKSDAGPAAADSHFDQEVSRHDLARMVVQHGYPFSIVNDAGFRMFVKNLQPQFKILSYDEVKADCMRIYEIARIRLHEVLNKIPCRVSLSIDTWQSNRGEEFLCLTCHYIDDEWKVKKKILNFLHIDAPSMTSEEIGRMVLEKLHEWGINKKLASIVLDNCSNGEAVGKELLGSLRTTGFLLLNGDLLQAHVCAHMLNLMVQDSLEMASEIVNNVRATMHYVKSSEETFAKFQKAAKQQKPLVLDSPNNWASIYLMLDSACQYEAAFLQLAEWDAEYPGFLASKDWADVKALTEILEVLYHTMEKFPAVEKPTSNLYFNEICGIHLLLKTWRTSSSPVVASVASQMLKKFEQYWDSTGMVMAFASILDPRYKMKSVEYFFKLIYNEQYEVKTKIESVHKSFNSLYNEYAVRLASSSKNQAFLCYVGNSSGCTMSSNYENGGESKTISSITLSDAQRGLDQYLQETSSGQPMKSDLDMYLEEAVYRPKEGLPDNFDILGWWKSFAAKYPVLSLMARDILAIPVSILPLDSEATTLNDYFSAMDPVTIEGLVCAQDWLREEIEATHVDGNADQSMVPSNGNEYSSSPK
ncbi:zinc finger BED domain-containing protein RICESLEEPER 2-like [Ananas comosus]|uniref:Zinc finger BED domain-containing protein RICESLEEPER 2-like n=1 Tax=Ananas comosus TaxID=4615 RepID=A0A6P5GE27_ANACO|nr:zinc finger BED domain-containing protein RICESLEEPER 2-like [Ananas comosus]XP_020106128.1 zinc finger BED domain-containing protein RICESLEEPER 2-like [Ananas comosus]